MRVTRHVGRREKRKGRIRGRVEIHVVVIFPRILLAHGSSTIFVLDVADRVDL